MKKKEKENNKKIELADIKNHYKKLLPKGTSSSLNDIVNKKIKKQKKEVRELKNEVLDKDKILLDSVIKFVLYNKSFNDTAIVNNI